jgi:N,N'-diacetyllegionaminate synthase
MIKTLIIAEVGVNHNGKLSLAKKLVKLAARAGADVVKFQIFKSENLVTKYAKKSKYQITHRNKNNNQFNLLKKLELSSKCFSDLKKECVKFNVEFCASCFDLESAELLKKLKVKRIKIPSGEITNYFLLKKIASFKKKVILSTGMSNLSEIKDAVSILTKNGLTKHDITILHCNTEYPTPLKDVNLKAMLDIKKKFNMKVGYSDHTQSSVVPVAAVALGSKIIEKHITINKKLDGPDHSTSLNFTEFKNMVKQIRNTEVVLGKEKKTVSKSEKKNIITARTYIVALKKIKKNENFSLNNLTCKRSSKGISPMKILKLLKKKATKNYRKDEVIKN